ncbi:NAD(P)H-hydrate dehydratase [Apibacter muscae]|uniref:Bifunctional NAD(P)H-hydrate repair enzyme n=1 Tax=Apibacter muscae TaxID=2509004 RepID=A0A563DB17_9FLAO|nr:NAD(P)H-hydrate dehydratase [Apibacter muscae]TWP27287.1 NAD(P)H-hydrate dehydratase [Apibacter muscae]TWP28508.1 NAD(P)H-hydrate dehydratase [Apibacter muscae]
MKIFKKEQLRLCDEHTIKNRNLRSIDLMEVAATNCYKWITERYTKDYSFYVVCGKGNNGGDGLALARMLVEGDYEVEVLMLQSKDDLTEDTQINFDRFPKSVQFIDNDSFEIENFNSTILIDALFGIGLNRSLDGIEKKIIDKINQISAIKISIDIPSGLPSDELPKENQTIFKADETLTFGFIKRSFLHKEGAEYTGNVHIIDLDLDQDFVKNEATDNFIISNNYIKNNIRKRQKFEHKGDFGKALLIGGSYGQVGSIALSTNAALRVGTGIVHTLAPECGYQILQTLAPEAIFHGAGQKIVETIELLVNDYTLGIGPGLGSDNITKGAFEQLLKNENKPLVLDADALNIIATDKKLLKSIPENSILTPHPKEFERIFGKTNSSLEQCELARKKAIEFKIHIVLKGHYTTILTPLGICYYNPTGNAGMAKGGSGDVLTGIITGLLAQSYSPTDAAIIGCYLHGKAGDIAALKKSQEAMTAQDIINYLSEVFVTLNK